MRRDNKNVGRRIMEMKVEGRRRDRPRKKCVNENVLSRGK